MGEHLTEAVIARRHRVPLPERIEGDGAAVARQLDAALMSAGFKLSRELFEDLSSREAGQVLDTGVGVLRAARGIAGDDVPGTTRTSATSRSTSPRRSSSGPSWPSGRSSRGLSPAERMKSDLRGRGRVALPLAFVRGEDGRWRAKWLHFYLKGHPSMNVVQGHKLTTSLLARTVIERDYVRVGYLAGLMASRTADGVPVRAAAADEVGVAVKDAPGPVTYIGLDRPEGLPAGATVFTLGNLAGLIPE